MFSSDLTLDKRITKNSSDKKFELKKFKQNLKKTATVIVPILISFSVMDGIGVNKNSKMFDGIDTTRMMQTNHLFGTSFLHYSVDSPEIKLNILDQFTQEQKQQLVKGITELDADIKGFNYTISFENKDVKKAINIKMFDQAEQTSASGVLATTYFCHTPWSSQITYPITIKMKRKTFNIGASDVIKHELLHTLGFKDLDQKKYIGNLMYCAYHPTNKMADEEQQILDALYGENGRAIKYKDYETSYPTKVKVYKKQDQDELAF